MSLVLGCVVQVGINVPAKPGTIVATDNPKGNGLAVIFSTRPLGSSNIPINSTQLTNPFHSPGPNPRAFTVRLRLSFESLQQVQSRT